MSLSFVRATNIGWDGYISRRQLPWGFTAIELSRPQRKRGARK